MKFKMRERVSRKEEDDEDDAWSTASSSSCAEQVLLRQLPLDASFLVDDTTPANYSKGRCGKTFRKSPFHFRDHHSQVQIQRTTNSKKYNEEGTTEWAVTEIDNYFDFGFKCQPLFIYCNDAHRSLNTPERWEEVEAMLQTNAIHTVKKFVRFNNSIEMEYYVPVTGHLITDSFISARDKRRLGSGKKPAPKSWLFWNGKFYDPSIIYELSESDTGLTYLKPLCTLGAKSHEDNIQSFDDDKIKLVGKGVLTKTYKNSTMSRKSHLELDLKHVVDITHIATLGGYPSHIDTFPKATERRLLSTRRVCRGKDRRKRRARGTTVYVVRNSSYLSWVKSYTISYKDVTTGKWLQYIPEFSANQDVGSEVINEVSLRSRYIRISPNQYHNHKEMRVKVYGKEIIKEEKGEGCAEVVFGASDIETIKYTVKPQVTTKYRLDGIGGGYYDYYYGSCTKHAKREELRQFVSREIEAM